MSNKKPKHCLLCQVIAPNVFALSCDHVLCLSCAAELTSRSKNVYSIICTACGQQTQFQLELYEELQKQMRVNWTSTSKLSRRFNEQLANANPRVSMRDKDLSTLKYCKEHQDIDLTYVCKTCEGSLICGECVITGRHSQHHVVTIQTEGKQIKSLLQNQLTSLAHKLSDLKNLQSTRLTAIQQRKHELQNLRYLINQQYDQVREAIRAQELSVLARCNELIELHRREEAQFRNQIIQQIDSCEYQRITITQLLDPFLKDDQLNSSRSHFKIETIKLIANYQINLPSIQDLAKINSIQCSSSYDREVRSLKEKTFNRRPDSYGNRGCIKMLEKYKLFGNDNGKMRDPMGSRGDILPQVPKGDCSVGERVDYFNLL